MTRVFDKDTKRFKELSTDQQQEEGLVVRIPKGPKGDKGDKGEKGDIGPAGKDGATGPMGPAGATGKDGAPGPAGQDGPAGEQGLPGPAGQDGRPVELMTAAGRVHWRHENETEWHELYVIPKGGRAGGGGAHRMRDLEDINLNGLEDGNVLIFNEATRKFIVSTISDGVDGADGADGADGVGVPVGGTTGQVLAKIDGTDYNTEWVAQSGGGGTPGGSSGQLQYNNAGSFAGVADITYDGTDIIVSSDNNTHMLFVDGSDDVIGINTSTPNSAASMHILAPTTGTSYRALLVEGSSTTNAGITIKDNSTNYATIGISNGKLVMRQGQFVSSGTPYIQFSTSGHGASIHASASTNLYGQGNINAEVPSAASYPAFQALMAGTPSGTEKAFSVVSQVGGAGGFYNSRFTVDYTGLTNIYPLTASTKGLVIKGAASQTANLQEWQDSSGAVLSKVSANGVISSSRNTTANEIFGDGAGASITTGANNVAVGNDALSGILAGSNNVAIGSGAMNYASATSGTRYNTVVGANAGSRIDSGEYNTFIGRYAGLRTGSGDSNVMIGASTNQGITAGSSASGNIFIGYQSGYYETGSNKFFVDNQSRTNEATARVSSLLYGVMDATPLSQTLDINAQVGILGSLNAQQNIVVGTGAIATTATDGFIYLGSCAGKPTGTPTTKTGRVPLVYDSTNKKFYLYDGAWIVFGSNVGAMEAPLGGAIADGTYIMHTYAVFAFTINSINGLKHTSGTSTLAVKINGTDVTGLSALSVSSTPQNATATAANSVAIGDQITFVVSSGSSPVDLFSTLSITRT